MQLSKLMSMIHNGVCQVIIPYSCKHICFGAIEKHKNIYAVWSWYSCRDIFHTDFPVSTHIFIYHKGYSATRMRKFLQTIENNLNLSNPSVIYKTVRKSVSLIILSDFWHEKMKFSLFTLLMRYGIDYNLINFDLQQTIKCGMLHDTLPALQLFFSGLTEYTGSKSGWFEQFERLNKNACMKYLC